MHRVIAGGLVVVMACAVVACKPAPEPTSPSQPAAAENPLPTPSEAPGSRWIVFEALPEATIYIDPSSIQKDGDRAEMWALIDYKNPQPDKTGKQVLSDKLRYEYDCKLRHLTITDTSAHAGPMGGGDIININPDPPESTPVPAGTTAEKMWARACGDAAS